MSDLHLLSERIKSYIHEIPSQCFPIPYETEGIEIIKKNGKTFISVTEGENYNRYEVREVLKIEWDILIKEEGIFQVPQLRTYDGELYGEVSVDPRGVVLKKFGFMGEQKVELPEPIVKLPIPEWVTLETDWPNDWPNAGMVVKYCFASEAEEMILKFKRELEKMEKQILGEEYSERPEEFLLASKTKGILEAYKEALRICYSSGAYLWGESKENGELDGFETALKLLGVSQEDLSSLTHEAAAKYARETKIVEINPRVEATPAEKKSFFSDPIGNLRKMMKI